MDTSTIVTIVIVVVVIIAAAIIYAAVRGNRSSKQVAAREPWSPTKVDRPQKDTGTASEKFIGTQRPGDPTSGQEHNRHGVSPGRSASPTTPIGTGNKPVQKRDKQNREGDDTTSEDLVFLNLDEDPGPVRIQERDERPTYHVHDTDFDRNRVTDTSGSTRRDDDTGYKSTADTHVQHVEQTAPPSSPPAATYDPPTNTTTTD